MKNRYPVTADEDRRRERSRAIANGFASSHTIRQVGDLTEVALTNTFNLEPDTHPKKAASVDVNDLVDPSTDEDFYHTEDLVEIVMPRAPSGRRRRIVSLK